MSVWYQMLSSHGHGVSTVEMKFTALGSVTSTMYSLAPIPSKARHFVVRHVGGLRFEPPAGMCEADDGALRSRPAQNRQIPRGPVFEALRAGIILVLQPEQHEVTGMARRETRHLDVVVQQAIGG